MNNKIFTIAFFIQFILCSLLLNSPSYAQNPKQSVINISKITTWVREDGFHDWVVGNEEFNGAYPNSLPVGVIFSEGIVWGGLIYDGQSPIVRVNGNTYMSGCAPITRLYKVRTDYYKADLKKDAAVFFNKDINSVTNEDIEQIKSQYEKDWNEWPAEKGAPYFDEDGDGKYNPDVDVPGVPGALQTIWIDYNDSLSSSIYGSPPIGLEIQETYWAYTNANPLGNVIYKKVDIIYKGTASSASDSRIDSMYICQWSDPDVGNSTDDFSGCDTLLNLGYSYNFRDPDLVYKKLGMAPPAVGYGFLQGVSKYTGNNTDSAIINFKWRKGRKYVNIKSMSRFIYDGPGSVWASPTFNYNGTLEFYNMMRGYMPIPYYPSSFQFPSIVADYTPDGVFLLDGDPVTGTGKIDGIFDGAGDKEMWLMSGPFNLSLGDTAEVAIALVGGMGKNHLSSITELRNNTRTAALFYNYFVEDMTNGTIHVPPPERTKSKPLPEHYVLYQNYPNPFNSSTTITYELPEKAFVTLIVYDVLGREVSRLVEKSQEPSRYSIRFDAGNLSSGIYFYKITFNNTSSKLVFDKLYKTMKMILLK